MTTTQSTHTIDDLARQVRDTHDLDTLDAALQVVTVHVDQIVDDPDLYDPDSRTLTDAGAEVILGAVAQSYDLGITGTAAAQLLEDIAAEAAAIEQLQEKIARRTEARDGLIRRALGTELRRRDIWTSAGITEARLYQIRDGRR